MPPRLRLNPEAEADLVEAFAWYEGQRPGLGSEFFAEVGARRLRNEFFFSAPQLKRDSLGSGNDLVAISTSSNASRVLHRMHLDITRCVRHLAGSCDRQRHMPRIAMHCLDSSLSSFLQVQSKAGQCRM